LGGKVEVAEKEKANSFIAPSRTTVGQVIVGLFPNGIPQIEDLLLGHLEYEKRRGNISKRTLKSNIKMWKQWTGDNRADLLRSIGKKYTSIYAASKKSNRNKWALPPVSPFDAFAIAAALLAKSGAYHHVEPEAKGLDDKRLKRELKRTILIKNRTRKLLKTYGTIWQSSFGYSINLPPLSALVITMSAFP